MISKGEICGNMKKFCWRPWLSEDTEMQKVSLCLHYLCIGIVFSQIRSGYSFSPPFLRRFRQFFVFLWPKAWRYSLNGPTPTRHTDRKDCAPLDIGGCHLVLDVPGFRFRLHSPCTTIKVSSTHQRVEGRFLTQQSCDCLCGLRPPFYQWLTLSP